MEELEKDAIMWARCWIKGAYPEEGMIANCKGVLPRCMCMCICNSCMHACMCLCVCVTNKLYMNASQQMSPAAVCKL